MLCVQGRSCYLCGCSYTPADTVDVGPQVCVCVLVRRLFPSCFVNQSVCYRVHPLVYPWCDVCV